MINQLNFLGPSRFFFLLTSCSSCRLTWKCPGCVRGGLRTVSVGPYAGARAGYLQISLERSGGDICGLLILEREWTAPLSSDFLSPRPSLNVFPATLGALAPSEPSAVAVFTSAPASSCSCRQGDVLLSGVICPLSPPSLFRGGVFLRAALTPHIRPHLGHDAPPPSAGPHGLIRPGTV